MVCKFNKILALVGLLTLALMIPVYGENRTDKNSVSFSNIQGRDWILTEVRTDSNIVSIDRTKPRTDEYYTLRFNVDLSLRGRAAPNMYFGPYTIGENKSLSIGMLATTRMAPLANQDLKEREYFSYLKKIIKWDFHNDRLELYASTEDGTQVVLVFSYVLV